MSHNHEDRTNNTSNSSLRPKKKPTHTHKHKQKAIQRKGQTLEKKRNVPRTSTVARVRIIALPGTHGGELKVSLSV